MKITEIVDMINKVEIEAKIFKYPKLLMMKERLDAFTEAKIDKRIVNDLVDKTLQDDGYNNYKNYIKTHKYLLNRTFRNALSENLIVGEVEFKNLMKALKVQGPCNTFLNIANNYVKASKLKKIRKGENLTVFDEGLFVAKEVILERQFDVIDYFLFKINERTNKTEFQKGNL